MHSQQHIAPSLALPLAAAAAALAGSLLIYIPRGWTRRAVQLAHKWWERVSLPLWLCSAGAVAIRFELPVAIAAACPLARTTCSM